MQINGPLKRAQFEELASDPVGVELVVGRLWKITSQNVFKVYDGAAVRTFADLNSAQTFQNKTLNEATFTQIATPSNPAAGFSKLYPKTDGKFYTLDSAGNEAAVGSGSGGGVDNLIVNGSADDTASSIFVPYADAAGTRPVDGTGGSPTVTTAITTTNPLNKTKSFTLVKPASNVQGQGWAVPFSVPLAYRAKSLKISTKFIVDSGTFVPGSPGVDGDVIVYLYDITNAQLIEPSNIKLLSNSSTFSDQYEATFQTSPTGSNYRLIFHVSTVSALAYTLKVDDVTVSPQNYVYGTPITDWQSYPLIITGSVTNPTKATTTVFDNAYWRRVGDNAELRYIYSHTNSTGTTSGSGNYLFSIPSFLSIDTNKLSINNAGSTTVGTAFVNGNAAANSVGVVTYADSGHLYLLTGDETTGPVIASSTFNNINQAGVTYSFTASVPIVGWSSSVQMSDQTDSRVVSFSRNINTALSLPDNTTTLVTYNVAGFDTHGAWDSVNSRYVVLVPGYYRVNAKHLIDTRTYSNAGDNADLAVHKNGTRYAYLSRFQSGASTLTTLVSLQGSTVVQCNAGDYLDIRIFQDNSSNTASTLQVDPNHNYVTIERISGPSAISSSEKVYAEYSTSAGQSMTASTNTRINYGTRLRDTHNAVTVGASWVFTAPRPDVYEVEASFAPTAQAASSEKQLTLFKNGVSYRRMSRDRNNAGGVDDQSARGATSLFLLAGETIDIRGLLSTTQNLTTADVDNWVTIKSHGGV